MFSSYNPFLKVYRSRLSVNKLFLSVKAFVPIAILAFISVSQYTYLQMSNFLNSQLLGSLNELIINDFSFAVVLTTYAHHFTAEWYLFVILCEIAADGCSMKSSVNYCFRTTL